MSLALENNRINGLFRNIPIVDRSTEAAMPMRVVERVDNLSLGPTTSSSSSSIGKDSDDDEGGDDEVESKLNNNNNNESNNNNNNNTENTPFDSAVDDLEQALPIRRGISKFYDGKSKSFASLADVACTSLKDITKPENPYSRKRKNLLAYNLLNDKSRRYPLYKHPGIPKRPISSSHSTLNFDIGSIDENESSSGTSWSNGSGTPSDSPPASPHLPWRSFSLADLQQYAVSPNGNEARFELSPLMEKRTKPDEVF